jgi:hypothetical protein
VPGGEIEKSHFLQVVAKNTAFEGEDNLVPDGQKRPGKICLT